MPMRLLKRFHRDEGAQISFLAVAAAICFVGLLSMVINTDDVITDRVHMQDIADTTALSSAAWTARGLNMISFINVLNSKLISTAVLLNALADTIPAVKVVAEIQRAIFQACTGVPFVGAFCAAMATVVNIQIAVLNPLDELIDQLAENLSRCSSSKNGALWTLMRGLNAAATGVRESFTAIGFIEGVKMAQENGADFGIVVNGNMMDINNARDAIALPVEQADFDAFCPYVKNGGSGYKMAGYNCGEGPYRLGRKRINRTILIPFTNLFAQPIFLGISAGHFAQIGCTGDQDDEDSTFPVTLRNLAECREFDATARWAHVYSTTGPITDADISNAGNLTVNDFAPWKQLTEDKDTGESDEETPDLSDIGDINVTPGSTPGAGDTNFVPGRAYRLLGNERRTNRDFPVSCNGPVYPAYAKPADFDSDEPGQLLQPFQEACVALNPDQCKRVNQWSEFRWYSAAHQSPSSNESVGGYFIRVGKRTIEPDPEVENDPTRYSYIVETVSLIDAGKKDMDQQEFEDYMNRQRPEGTDAVNTEAQPTSENCEKPEPYMLDKGDSAQDEADFQNKLRFVAVVWRDIQDDQPFWSNYFNTPPKVLLAYGQAQVYNHLSEDTFTQDWRVRLEQASLLEDLLESDKSSQIGGKGALGSLGAVIGRVNNH